MNDVTDPFLVTTPRGIASVLRSIATLTPLMHMRIDGYDQALITTLLDVNPAENLIVVDAAREQTFNRLLARAEKVHFDTLVDKIRVQFETGRPVALVFDGRDAFRMPFPQAVRRLQRRNHFRVDIPVSTPLICKIPHAGKTHELRARDISAGGIALLNPGGHLQVTPGALLPACVLDLPDLGLVTVNLQVQRVAEAAANDAHAGNVIACRFSDLNGQALIMVQNYIGRLERLLNARRRGFN